MTTLTMKRILLALSTVGAVTVAPQAHADGQCTALANDTNAFNACMHNANEHCTAVGIMLYGTRHVSCTYPDGGRDECTVQHALTGQEVGASCQYFPPGQ
jgi:hypothetical protein